MSSGKPVTGGAHGGAFSADDTYRALDTMERLLTAVDATAEADEVRKLRRDTQQAAFEAETRRAVRSVAGVEGTWRGTASSRGVR